MSDHEHDALRAHFAARAEDIHPSVDLARRVAEIRPPARGLRPSLRMTALAFGGLAAGAAAAVVLLISHHGPEPDRPSPLAPPATGAPVNPAETSSTLLKPGVTPGSINSSVSPPPPGGFGPSTTPTSPSGSTPPVPSTPSTAQGGSASGP